MELRTLGATGPALLNPRALPRPPAGWARPASIAAGEYGSGAATADHTDPPAPPATLRALRGPLR